MYVINISYAGSLEKQKKEGFFESKLLNKFRMVKNKQQIKEIKQKIAGYPHKDRKSCLLFFLPLLFLDIASSFHAARDRVLLTALLLFNPIARFF